MVCQAPQQYYIHWGCVFRVVSEMEPKLQIAYASTRFGGLWQLWTPLLMSSAGDRLGHVLGE